MHSATCSWGVILYTNDERVYFEVELHSAMLRRRGVIALMRAVYSLEIRSLNEGISELESGSVAGRYKGQCKNRGKGGSELVINSNRLATTGTGAEGSLYDANDRKTRGVRRYALSIRARTGCSNHARKRPLGGTSSAVNGP